MQSIDPLSLVRPDLRTLENYVGVKPLEVIAEEIGVDVDEIVKLDANENLFGALPEIVQQIAAANHHIYPDPSQTLLRRDIAQYMGVDESMVVAGAGSDDLIDLLIRLARPGPILISTPTFGMYSFLAKISQSPILDIPRGPPPLFALDTSGILQAIEEHQVSIVFLVSPNNPTGNLIPNDEIDKICKAQCLVVVDEAYAEFSGASAVSLLSKYSNLVILRTFSKWAGLAGLRAGFAVAHRSITNIMMGIKQPYNINTAADVACRAALSLRPVIQKQIDAINEEKEYLRAKLAKYKGIYPLESSANFFLCHVHDAPFSAGQLRVYLRRLGVLIRFFEKPAFMSDFIRVSAGRRADSTAFLRCLDIIYSTSIINSTQLRRCLPIKGILFDMDGVLADESTSYREAMILTAQSFGVTITPTDISDAKASGFSNNDWICTQQMLSARNVSVSLDEVTSRFERFYQGDADTPGLWQQETLIPKVSLIRFLASQVPLAIVTGRPRADAIRFLTHYRIVSFFSTIVCMEDAPSKPDPAPVNLALSSCNLTSMRGHVLMVGDTPNDAIAARGAGIVPLGILAPKEKGSDAMPASLRAAGVENILTDLDELRLLFLSSSTH